MIEPFAEGLTYDRWANLEWTNKLHVLEEAEKGVRGLAASSGAIPDSEPLAIKPALKVMAHIGFAHRVWLLRFDIDAPWLDVSANKSVSAAEVAEALSQAPAAWGPVLERDPEEAVEYRNLRGEPQRRKVGDILRHVINHGTYHRGQVRQIVEDLGVKDFPDTDYLYFAIARDAGRLHL